MYIWTWSLGEGCLGFFAGHEPNGCFLESPPFWSCCRPRWGIVDSPIGGDKQEWDFPSVTWYSHLLSSFPSPLPSTFQELSFKPSEWSRSSNPQTAGTVPVVRIPVSSSDADICDLRKKWWVAVFCLLHHVEVYHQVEQSSSYILGLWTPAFPLGISRMYTCSCWSILPLSVTDCVQKLAIDCPKQLHVLELNRPTLHIVWI